MKELIFALLVILGFIVCHTLKREFKRGWCVGFIVGAKYGAAFYTNGRWIPMVCGNVTNEWVLCWNDPKDGSLRFFEREASNQSMLDAVYLLDATNDVGITSLTSDVEAWCTTIHFTAKMTPEGTNVIEVCDIYPVRKTEKVQQKISEKNSRLFYGKVDLAQ